MITKAAAMPEGFRANMIREHARQLLEDHPVAPRRGAAVRKAKAEDEPVPVFDAAGNLVGICDAADITPVAGKQATPSAPAAVEGEPVAKNARLSVWDGAGRRYVTTRSRIRKTGQPRPGVYDAGPLYRVGDDTGYGTGAGSPEVQARNRGPVSAGGTTGLGQPRRTGPAGSLPVDGPQRALPGDPADRQVVKALGSAWTEVRDYRGALVGAVRRSDITALPAGRVLKGGAAQTHANVYSLSRRLIGVAKMADIIPLTDLR
jgi:hypothetical protein